MKIEDMGKKHLNDFIGSQVHQIAIESSFLLVFKGKFGLPIYITITVIEINNLVFVYDAGGLGL